MVAKEADRQLLWGWNYLHTIIDKSPDSRIADVALYLSSSNRYDDRQHAIIQALEENGVTFSLVPLKEIEGVSEDTIEHSHDKAIKIKLPLATTKEEQISGIQTAMRRFAPIENKLPGEAADWTIGGIGDEERIAAIVKAVEAAYQNQGTAKSIAPSQLPTKDSHIERSVRKKRKPPQVG